MSRAGGTRQGLPANAGGQEGESITRIEKSRWLFPQRPWAQPGTAAHPLARRARVPPRAVSLPGMADRAAPGDAGFRLKAQ